MLICDNSPSLVCRSSSPKLVWRCASSSKEPCSSEASLIVLNLQQLKRNLGKPGRVRDHAIGQLFYNREH